MFVDVRNLKQYFHFQWRNLRILLRSMEELLCKENEKDLWDAEGDREGVCPPIIESNYQQNWRMV